MKIVPIRTGTIYCNKTVLTYGKGFDVFLEIPVIAWYIEKGNTKILVDTGMCDTARAHQYHYKHSTQNKDERIVCVLKYFTKNVVSVTVLLFKIIEKSSLLDSSNS